MFIENNKIPTLNKFIPAWISNFMPGEVPWKSGNQYVIPPKYKMDVIAYPRWI